MSLARSGGLAALICAATYPIGFALLVTLLAPLGFGLSEIDPAAVVAFIDANTELMIAWNTTIYLVNALAVHVVVVHVKNVLGQIQADGGNLHRVTPLNRRF